MDGTYALSAADSSGAVLSITRPGTAAHWITYKALPGQQPKIVTKGWNGIFFGPTAASNRRF